MQWLIIFFTVQQDSLKLVLKSVESVENATGCDHDANRRNSGQN